MEERDRGEGSDVWGVGVSRGRGEGPAHPGGSQVHNCVVRPTSVSLRSFSSLTLFRTHSRKTVSQLYDGLKILCGPDTHLDPHLLLQRSLPKLHPWNAAGNVTFDLTSKELQVGLTEEIQCLLVAFIFWCAMR